MSVTDELRRQIQCHGDWMLDFVCVDHGTFAEVLLKDNVVVRSLYIDITALTHTTERSAVNSGQKVLTFFYSYLEMNPSLNTIEVFQAEYSPPLMASEDFRLAATNLFASLIKNTCIKYFTCHAWIPDTVLGPYLANAPSLSDVFIAFDHFGRNSEIEGITNALVLNQTMVRLQCTHSIEHGAVWSNFVLRLLDHPTMEKFHFSEGHEGRDAMLSVQVTSPGAQSSKRVRVEGTKDIDIGFNSILTRLLTYTTTRDISLQAWKYGKRVLPDSLPAFLECTSTNVQMLSLDSFKITETCWISLRNALKSNAKVTRFELAGCTFDRNATNDFMNSIGSVVARLDLQYGRVGFNKFEQVDLQGVYARLLVTESKPLKYLRVNGLRYEGSGHVFGSLETDQTSDIQVETLHLDCIFPSDIVALEMILPWCTKLRTLIVDRNECRAITHAFQRNGSLYKVKIHRGLWKHSAQKRLLAAFGRRNRRIPRLLTNVNGETSPVLIPSLFFAAQQAARVAPNTLLLGLLANRMTTAGPKISGDKRTVSHDFEQRRCNE
jgi:hypothetical protein